MVFKVAVTAGFEPAISSVTSWHPGPTERCYQLWRDETTPMPGCKLSLRFPIEPWRICFSSAPGLGTLHCMVLLWQQFLYLYDRPLLFSRVSLSTSISWNPSMFWILNKSFWLGLSVDPNRLLFSSLSGQVLVAQDLYTPASLLVRRIWMDLWHFCQGYHSHYTTLHSRVHAKDSCRIRRMPPPALSLLTVLLLHLASSIRLHITEA